MDDNIDEMYMAFRRYGKMLQKEIRKQLDKYNLSSQHANYLIALHNKDGLTLKELNQIVDNDGAATTRIVKKLSDCDLTMFDYINSKSYIVRLTDKGKSVSENLLESIGKLRHSFIKVINP